MIDKLVNIQNYDYQSILIIESTMIKTQKLGEKNMTKTAIKLTILSIILLVSASSIVLGATYGATNMSDINSTNDMNASNSGVNISADMNTSNNTGMSTDANTANTTMTPSQGNVVDTSIPTVTSQGNVVDTSIPAPQGTTAPQETSAPPAPPKSPGFGGIISVAVLLLAMYIYKKR